MTQAAFADDTWLAALYEELVPRLRSHLFRRTGDPDLTEMLVEETFDAICRRFPRLDPAVIDAAIATANTQLRALEARPVQ